jgi:hypothetical protein
MFYSNWTQRALDGVKANMNQYTKLFIKCSAFKMTLLDTSSRVYSRPLQTAGRGPGPDQVTVPSPI